MRTDGAGVLTLSAVGALLLSALEQQAAAMALLAACILIDYATGLVRGWMNGTLSSRLSLKGLVKKACYLLGVCVGLAVDLLLLLVRHSLGIGVPKAVFGLLVCLLLVINELISVVENLQEIGVPLPAALVRVLAQVREKTGEQQPKD